MQSGTKVTGNSRAHPGRIKDSSGPFRDSEYHEIVAGACLQRVRRFVKLLRVRILSAVCARFGHGLDFNRELLVNLQRRKTEARDLQVPEPPQRRLLRYPRRLKGSVLSPS